MTRASKPRAIGRVNGKMKSMPKPSVMNPGVNINVPPTKITGTVTLTPASTPLVARVSVPTDAGVYLVIMSRSDDSPTWLADRIMPPEGQGDS